MDAYIWLGLMVLFLIIEGACAIHLVSIWFAAGSLAAAVTALLKGSLWLQLLLFVAVSGVLLICFWPIVKKLLNPKVQKTNIDSLIGARAYVTADIDNVSALGKVKLNGMEWTARSQDGGNIPTGTLVTVDHIEGVKVFVSPVKEPAAPGRNV